MKTIDWSIIDPLVHDEKLTYREAAERSGECINTIKAHYAHEVLKRKLGRPTPHAWGEIDPILAKTGPDQREKVLKELRIKYPAINSVTLKERYKTIRAHRHSSTKPVESDNSKSPYLTRTPADIANESLMMKLNRLSPEHRAAILAHRGRLSAASSFMGAL